MAGKIGSVAATATSPLASSLIQSDGKMSCPNCEEARHLQWYDRLGQVEKYAMETNPVYMCSKSEGGCGHIFSPGDHSLLISLLSPPKLIKSDDDISQDNEGVTHA